ncbi:MAG: glycoside hydrolase family 3 N-terminal domain-containing protein [Calditrichia bacterium]
MKLKRTLLGNLFLITLIFLVNSCEKSSSEPVFENHLNYLNPELPVAERVADLLSRMTLREKIGQMTQAERQALVSLEDLSNWGLGSLLSGGGSAPAVNHPAAWADMYDEYQSWALKSRLRIPLIYGIDAVHGHNNVKGAVIFPHNIGMGCMRNPELYRKAMAATAEEVAGTGIDWTFAPCIAVPRDERWGRTYEGFGETAEATVLMARAGVLGFQGTNLADPATILACAKHFVGDGGTTNGHDQGNTEIDEQTLREIHLPGYIQAIQAGVGSIMVSYSSWNGQKMHSHKYLLTDVLKGELGFEGFLISDWGAVDQLAGDYATQIETAINAGLDMIMVPYRYKEFIETLTQLVQSGRVPQSRIDDAVRRILTIKFKLGLFEEPFTNRALTATIGSPEHRSIARECVRQSLVLLKNENSILPLKRDSLKILVAGKNADDLGNQCGGWSITWQGSSGPITVGTTILEGIREVAGPHTEVIYRRDGSGFSSQEVGVAIAVIGELPYAEGAGDRQDLSLDEEDRTCLQNLEAAGIPTIGILISGRPLIIGSELNKCRAFMAAWLPGTEGAGVADVLFGVYKPTGRLTHSWPKSMSQIPINRDDPDYNPLFPYGFGLTYE